MEKKDNGFILVILIVVVLGLVGYLVYDKVVNDNNEPIVGENNNENNSQNNNEVEEVKLDKDELSAELTEIKLGFSEFSNGETSLDKPMDRLIFVALILNNEAKTVEVSEGWNVKYISKTAFVDKYNELFGSVNNFEEDFKDKDNILFTGEEYESINNDDIVWNSVLGGAQPTYITNMIVVNIEKEDDIYIVTGFAEYDDESKKDFELRYNKVDSKLYITSFRTMG